MSPRSMILVCVAVLLGCGTEPADVAQSAHDSVGMFMAQQPRGYARASRPQVAAAVPTTLGQAFDPNEYALEENLSTVTAPTVTNMVIRTATASIKVDSLEPAIAQVKQLATQFGGYVGSSGVLAGKNQLRQATIEVKIPATRFDEVLSGLAPIGELESVNVEAEDVGEEFVDVTARMDNAKRLEQRLIDLLAKRTGKLKDVLDVEQALARVRQEIERYEGRMRYLRAHVAMSTLNVTVHEPAPVVGTAGQSVMGAAVRQAWRNCVALVSFAITSLGVIIPLGIIALVGWIATRRWRQMKQRTA